MKIILFGLSGAGKNYVGEILARHFEFYFWDADQSLSQEMQNAITQRKQFTQDMRDDFTQTIIKKLAELQSSHQNLVIAQALYKEKNREQIQKAFPKAQFLLVQATEESIASHLNNSESKITSEYAAQISQNYESPILSHKVIHNDSDEAAIIEQLIKLFPETLKLSPSSVTPHLLRGRGSK